MEIDENLLMVGFDASALIKRKRGAHSAIVWKISEWTVIATASKTAMDFIVDAAQYVAFHCLGLIYWMR